MASTHWPARPAVHLLYAQLHGRPPTMEHARGPFANRNRVTFSVFRLICVIPLCLINHACKVVIRCVFSDIRLPLTARTSSTDYRPPHTTTSRWCLNGMDCSTLRIARRFSPLAPTVRMPWTDRLNFFLTSFKKPSPKDHAKHQSNNQSINQCINQWISQSMNQSIDQSIHQSINQSTRHWDYGICWTWPEPYWTFFLNSFKSAISWRPCVRGQSINQSNTFFFSIFPT